MQQLNLLHAWNIGPALEWRTPATGTLNQTLLVRTARGRYVLRGYRHRERLPVEREHAIIAHAAAQGIPAIAPLPLPDGATILEREGRFFALFPHAPGQQVARADLGEREWAAMGRCLAVLHRALAAYPAERVTNRSLIPDPAATLPAIQRIESVIRDKPALDELDQIVLAELASRRAWLQQHAADAMPDMRGLPQQALHGDYQETNLFFDRDEVSAVIDWEKPYCAPRAWEVARTIDLALLFQPAACQAFLVAYRALLPLPLAELDTAMRCYSMVRAHDLWIYNAFYFEHNERVRQFIAPGAFRPLVERWEALKSLLSIHQIH